MEYYHGNLLHRHSVLFNQDIDGDRQLTSIVMATIVHWFYVHLPCKQYNLLCNTRWLYQLRDVYSICRWWWECWYILMTSLQRENRNNLSFCSSTISLLSCTSCLSMNEAGKSDNLYFKLNRINGSTLLTIQRWG
jgi:hypothetical protein